MILVTGGAGFIGSNFILNWFKQSNEPLLNLDKLTYAGNLENLVTLINQANYFFVHGDINNGELVEQLLLSHQPRAIIHFAAESHVDRSIHDADAFIETNINGTYQLLKSAKKYWSQLTSSEQQQKFRFLHVSTDEVYGSLSKTDPAFTEESLFQPNSPYSASKAASDHLVRAWYHTYQLPVLITHCSNNYGPYQFPEKLIPHIIVNALAGKALPIYGDGLQVRDWLYVTDHCNALLKVLDRGVPGETYNIGGWNEKTNLDIVHAICDLLQQLHPRSDGKHYHEQITYVTDRPGHDRRYAINADKIANLLGWQPSENFASGLRKTLDWYLTQSDWLNHVQSGSYRTWIKQHYSGNH